MVKKYGLPKIMVFDQGNLPECGAFSVLGALKTMKPDIDHEKIIKEIIIDQKKLFSLPTILKWFQEKGYIKGSKRVSWIPSLLNNGPFITGVAGVGEETGNPPYTLTISGKGSHYMIAREKGEKGYVIQNSWSPRWGDGGDCYYSGDLRKLKTPYQIIL